jgi:hypothetical protein
MLNRGTHFYLWCGLSVLLTGCCTAPNPDPVADFRRKHPSEARAYTHIYPVGTDMYDMIFRVKSVTISGIGHSLKERFGDAATLADYADRILKQEAKAIQEWERLFAQLQAASTNGGFICEYGWSDGKTKETGLLVLKSGDVVKREPWLTDYVSEPSEPAPRKQ